MQGRVTFREMIQDSQDYGSNDQHMVSRVFFDFEIGGQRHDGLYVDVKQTVGSDFETAGLEVGAPHGYTGPFNHGVFRGAVEEYYRQAVGRAGSAIRIQGAGRGRMRNNRSISTKTVEFDVSQAGGW